MQAYERLGRGEFSTSPHVPTFLSAVSRYQASVRLISGSAILTTNFANGSAALCEDETYQICSFTKRIQDSVVRATSVQDIISGDQRLPFSSRTTWSAIKAECAHAHLKQGTRPSGKLTNVKNVKRYLCIATIAKDGLIVPSRECIVVLQQVLDGLLTALHIQLCHPSSRQLKDVTKRYLYALDMYKAIDRMIQACHHCASLRPTSKVCVEQSSCPPPDTVGVSFATDIIKRSRQLVLVLQESITSLTATTLLED